MSMSVKRKYILLHVSGEVSMIARLDHLADEIRFLEHA